MKLWTQTTFYVVLLVIFSGCATLTPKTESKIDPTLQVVKLTKYGVAVDINAIGFEWENITDTRVNGLYIYKRNESAGKSTEESDVESAPVYYKTLETRFKTHYVDTEVTPDTKYSYYFKTYSDDAESLDSEITYVNTLPILESVAWIQSIQNMPRSAKIIWRPHTNQKVESYIIERSTIEDNEWTELARIHGRLNAEYIDNGLKDKHTYKYRIRVLTFDDIISTPSEIVKVVTKPLPITVRSIVATKDLPKKIKLTWEESTIKDFTNFNVYRSENIDTDYELVEKTTETTFIDYIDEDGKEYYYRVSVIDQDDLESKHDEVSAFGSTIPRPVAPTLVKAILIEDDNLVHLVWTKSDVRTKLYTVVKTHKEGWFKTIKESFTHLEDEKFTDTNISRGYTYNYYILSIDENSISSKPSQEVEVEFKELEELPKAKEAPKSQEVAKEADIVTQEPAEITDEEAVSPAADLDLSEN